MINNPLHQLFKTNNWTFCLQSVGATLGTGLSVMLVGHKKSGKTSMVKRFGLAVEMNNKSSYFIESKVFMEMCRTNQAHLFCTPDLMVVEGIDWLDDRTIRFGLCLAHERRKFKKDTILCIDSTTDLQAIEIIWKGHEYTSERYIK